jgi:hypothetical protein
MGVEGAQQHKTPAKSNKTRFFEATKKVTNSLRRSLSNLSFPPLPKRTGSLSQIGSIFKKKDHVSNREEKLDSKDGLQF